MMIGYRNLCGDTCAICNTNVMIQKFAEDPENAIEYECNQCLPEGKIIVYNSAFTPSILRDELVLEYLRNSIQKYKKDKYFIAGWTLINTEKIIRGNASNRSYVGLFGPNCLFCGSQIQIITNDQIDGFTFRCLECNDQEPIGITGSIMRNLKDETEFRTWCAENLSKLRGISVAENRMLDISTNTYKLYQGT